MQHEQILSPRHVELQVTRLLQTRRHEAQKLLHVDVRKRGANYRNWNDKRKNPDQPRIQFTAVSFIFSVL